MRGFAQCNICSWPGGRLQDWVLDVGAPSLLSPTARKRATGSASVRDWLNLHEPARWCRNRDICIFYNRSARVECFDAGFRSERRLFSKR